MSSVASITDPAILSGDDPGRCDIKGLVNEQKRMCLQHKEAMAFVGQGVNDGLNECKHQFAFERWNCSGSGVALTGPVLNAGM